MLLFSSRNAFLLAYFNCLFVVHHFEELSFIEHWSDGVQFKCSSPDAVIIIGCQTAATLNQSRNLNLNIKNVDPFNQFKQEDLTAFWKPLLSILMEIERIMESFPGK